MISQLNPRNLGVAVRAANERHMAAFINADLRRRVGLDTRRSIVLYDENFLFNYALDALPNERTLRALYHQTPGIAVLVEGRRCLHEDRRQRPGERLSTDTLDLRVGGVLLCACRCGWRALGCRPQTQGGMYAAKSPRMGPDRKAGWRVSAIGHATAHLTNKLGTGRVDINR